MSLPKRDFIKILAEVWLLALLCELPAYAQTADLEQVILNDPVLEEKYGKSCTSIIGIEFVSLSRLNTSLQEGIDAAEDGDVMHTPYGYSRLAEPLDIDKDITIVGDQLFVIDTSCSCRLLNIENPYATER
jgi:hypothetical protein